MGMFLNNGDAYENYKEVVSDTYFVDKSELIAELLPAIGRSNKYFCFTRPRRFGKSVMANMVAAYFSKANDSHDIFDAFGHAAFHGVKGVRDMLSKTGHKFIFILYGLLTYFHGEVLIPNKELMDKFKDSLMWN